ncbi:SpaA isopeptide-forming pilin-related protein [uncultured Secundilactobacillus sp.]|uniref:SpaA isopeptide-forming pilin-related protein n=1 Tax=uncultured Secundilactobacillus sp. TaxID=2813935 RepID=UPI00258DC328|nr:SpaA isopeptide-forming pilin-related protein [uncultured Secundilactobacillus sp.]
MKENFCRLIMRRIGLLGIVATLVMVFSFIGASSASAKTVAVKGLDADGATLTEAESGKTVQATDSLSKWVAYKANYKWAINDAAKIGAGDTAVVTLPETVKPAYDYQFAIYSDDDAKISVGEFTIKAGSTVGTITFSDYFATHVKNRQGTLQITVNGTDTTGAPNTSWQINKLGWISSQDPVTTTPNKATWNIALNPNSTHLTNVVIQDTLGEGQRFNADSLVAHTGSFDANSTFKDDSGVAKPEITVTGNHVTIKFAELKTAINMTYTADLTKVPATQQWTNTATFSADGNGTPQTASSSATIAWGGSGNGEGDKETPKATGDVTLTKTSDGYCPKRLSGAVFSLYSKAGQLVKSDLTTNYRGQFTVDKLTAGDYYFVETKAPAGYQRHEGHVTFTINENKTTNVTVKDAKQPQRPCWPNRPTHHKNNNCRPSRHHSGYDFGCTRQVYYLKTDCFSYQFQFSQSCWQVPVRQVSSWGYGFLF